MHAVQWQVFVEQCSQLSQRQRLAEGSAQIGIASVQATLE